MMSPAADTIPQPNVSIPILRAFVKYATGRAAKNPAAEQLFSVQLLSCKMRPVVV